MIRVALPDGDFDPGAEAAALEAGGAGAVATFTGLVRADDGVVELFLEHHPAMTRAALTGLAEEAVARWPLGAVTILHRVGPLVPGDRIVFVGAASRHRAAALEACAYLIDRLKTDAPFWKRERLAGGATRWVEQRVEDERASERWRATGPAPE